MSVDSNYNRQFIQIDFATLDDPDFLRFVNRAEFATYLILRRFIWRGGEHRLGLHKLYAQEHKLACSISTARMADMLRLTDLSSISKHLSYLQKLGVVKTIRTGRESIYILGEWHKPQGWNVSKEFYYLENRFGDRKSDLEEISGSDLNSNQNSSERTSGSDVARTADQSWRKNHAYNREENREQNTVNGLKSLPNQDLTAGERDYLAQEVLDQLGDEHSRKFYRLVAAKIPEHVIRKALAEIKADGADNPAKLFTYRMNRYAFDRLERGRATR